MNTRTIDFCACGNCAGETCRCGCQLASAAAMSNARPGCACLGDCSCGKAEQACACAR